MSYSENILPKSAAYYILDKAKINGTDLVLEQNGYAEYYAPNQVLPTLTEKLLVVVHPSVYSSPYMNNAIQVTVSAITSSGKMTEYLIPVSETASGVFNTEITLPSDDTYVSFVYRISSAIPVTVYNWELCVEEAIDVTTVIGGVEQALPRLLYDYNTYAYAVAQQEYTVGLISCYLRNATDLQGHFTLSFFATERCNVHVRIKDNGITELYTPQVYTVEKGYASISIPHAYIDKSATEHAFTVSVQCTNGQLSIPVRGLLYTIDGGYLATRLLDAGIDVQDISIKQLPTDTSPSEIWAIGFEGNRLILKNRPYSLQTNANWEAIKDFGECKLGCVEFVGQWVNRNNSEKYTMETEEVPYVFIVGTEGTLVAYSGTDFSTEFIIDTDVTDASACQGFNSIYYVEQDQGLVVGYIKNGNVYTREYAYNSALKYKAWTAASPIYENGDAVHVSVHRLPDYRVGLCVEHSSGTTWFISGRTYVGQSVKTEMVDSSMSDKVLYVTMIEESHLTDNLGTAVLNEFEEGSTYYNTFTMRYDNAVFFTGGTTLDDLKESMKVYVNNNLVDDDIVSVEVLGNVVTVVTKDIRAGSTVKIQYNNMFVATTIYNNCIVPLTQEYTWTLPLLTIEASFDAGETEANIVATLNAVVTGIQYPKLSTPEDATSSSVDTLLDCQVKQIMHPALSISSSETDSFVSATLSVTVTLVGTTPI